ncbi:hypothetical protein [Aestuariivirga sp.]|uniref:hypothetical protein n=1 Tax=Aestuariivirga sp. TaxID=2650926 RepID=UPI0039E26735
MDWKRFFRLLVSPASDGNRRAHYALATFLTVFIAVFLLFVMDRQWQFWRQVLFFLFCGGLFFCWRTRSPLSKGLTFGLVLWIFVPLFFPSAFTYPDERTFAERLATKPFEWFLEFVDFRDR